MLLGPAILLPGKHPEKFLSRSKRRYIKLHYRAVSGSREMETLQFCIIEGMER